MEHASASTLISALALCLALGGSTRLESQPPEPEPPVPFVVCVENFFEKDDLLRRPSSVQRRLETSGAVGIATDDLAALKVKWDLRRNALRAEFSSRWDPQIEEGTLQTDEFLADAARARRQLLLGFAEDFADYLLTVDGADESAMKGFLRLECENLVVNTSAEGWTPEERDLQAQFLARIGGEEP